MEKNPPPGLIIIVGRWMTIPKQVVMALYQLTTRDSHYTVGEIFRDAACTSVKTSKRFAKFLLIAAIPFHVKWPVGGSRSM